MQTWAKRSQTSSDGDDSLVRYNDIGATNTRDLWMSGMKKREVA